MISTQYLPLYYGIATITTSIINRKGQPEEVQPIYNWLNNLQGELLCLHF